jgi:hypothetical protein
VGAILTESAQRVSANIAAVLDGLDHAKARPQLRGLDDLRLRLRQIIDPADLLRLEVDSAEDRAVTAEARLLRLNTAVLDIGRDGAAGSGGGKASP